MVDALTKLKNKEIKGNELAELVLRDRDLLPMALKGISSPKAHVRYPCAKTLTMLSEDKPEWLYPYFDFFVDLLNSEKRILKWNAINTLANLSKVDAENKVDAIFHQLFGLMNADYMVTVANVIGAAEKIDKAKPQLANRITYELFKVENLSLKPHLTLECRNILLGHTIQALDHFYENIENKGDVVSFVERQLDNTRDSTRIKAESFLYTRGGSQ